MASLRQPSADPAGVWITPLDDAAAGPGVPLAVKDLFDTAGVRTTYGSAVFAEHVPSASAEAVTRLEQGGYVTVGKANLHEFAYGTTTENPFYGTCPNPAAAGRVAGGSSGGSAAAVALGTAEGALGTDSGGSIRIPAACCGIAGFKPTYGLVPLDGCWPLAPTFDHAGPLARNVPGCIAMLRALVPGWRPLELDWLGDLRVGIAWLDGTDLFVRDRIEVAASFVPGTRHVDFPRPDPAVDRLFMREVADVHRELFVEARELYSDDLQRKLDRCLAVTAAEAAAGEAARSRYREQAEEAMAGIDLLLTPTLECVAPRLGEGGIADHRVLARLVRNTLPFNALGWPAFALPCGAAEHEAPASLQLVGRPGADGLVVAAAAVLERALRSAAAI